MKNWWVKLGCFLTGYNYNLVTHSSLASEKTVKKYTSAMLLIGIIWAFIGFVFTKRYILNNEVPDSFFDKVKPYIGALTMIVAIIQIERQIILSYGKNKSAAVFRILIGLIMAIIGSVIIDQVLLKEDIELAKIEYVQGTVNSLVPSRTNEIDSLIAQKGMGIRNYDHLIDSTNNIIKGNEFLIHYVSTTTNIDALDSNLDKSITEIKPISMANPLINSNEQNMRIRDTLSSQLYDLQLSKLTIRQDLEEEIKSKTGFINEIEILFTIILRSWYGKIIWILFFLFFLAIELFVLFNKFSDKDNDYEQAVLHQMNIRIDQLKALGNKE